MTAVPVTDAATVPGGSTGNSAASDSMFNADGTLFYLHHRDVGTFLYSADRGTGHVTPLGQLPASTPNGDPLTSEEHTSELPSPTEIYTLSLHDALPISVPVTDAATVPGGSTGNSAASDSMFNADGTLFYLHHRDVGTFLYSVDRGTGHVTPLGQLPASTPNGDPLAYDGAPWDPINPDVLYAIVMSTTRRELWQLTLPLPAEMTLLHDFSNEVPTGGYPSSRVQVSADGRDVVIVASTTGGSGTYDHVMVWDRQTGGSQTWQLPSGIGGLLLR